MVRKIKVLPIEPNEAAANTSNDQKQESATDHATRTKPDVAVFETTNDTEGLDAAVVEATAPEEPTTKPIIVDFSAPARKPRAAAKPRAARNSEPPPVAEAPSTPEVEEKSPPGLETQQEQEKEKEPPTPKRVRAKPKPKAQPQQDSREPTHAPDEVPERGPPPPSRAPKQKLETPDQFWSNTLKQMKEKKNLQYQKLAAASF
jgi:hypothetical protein